MNTLARKPRVHEVTTPDGAVLLDADLGHFYGLNPTASTMWQALLSTGASVEQIARDLSARFSAPHDEIHADISRLVTELSERGLLHAGTER